VAEGVYAGAHRSRRHGAGVEFGGHRAYVPGDDLRWIDRHALMRHERLMVRQFETDTDRGVHLLVDATASMRFRGSTAPAAKFAFAALIAAALSRVALATGDPVGLDWVGGRGVRPVPPCTGGDAFERIVGALASVQAMGDLSVDTAAFSRALYPVARRARRGAVVVLLSDLLDLPATAPAQLAAIGTAGRHVLAVQILDREELTLPYKGTVRLVSLEGDVVVETDADATRAGYLEALQQATDRWAKPLASRGSRVLRAITDDDPVDVLRAMLRAVDEGRR
jgi:uncharacterized protein (DUF58 family)